MIVLPAVDFPHPDSPISPNVSPLRISNVIPSTAFSHLPPLTLKCIFKSLISSNFSCFMIALHLLLTHPLVAPLLALVHLAASKPLYVSVNFLYNQAYYSHKLSWHKGNELQMGSL